METRSQHIMFVGLLLFAFVMAALVFLPYMTALVIAIVLSVIFRPLHRFVSKLVSKGDQGSSFAAIVTLLIIAAIVLTPLTFLGVRLYNESGNLYLSLTDEAERAKIITSLNNALYTISHNFFDVTPTFNFDSFNVAEYIQSAFDWLFSNLDKVFSSAAKIALNIFIILIALFYMLRDGGALRKQLIAFSPLKDSHEDQILNKLKQAIHSVVTGSIIVSMLQGLLSGLGFWIFGVPNPVLWGTVAMIAAFIPGVGTSLVLVPAVLYLFFNAPPVWHAVGLLIWGILAVGLIDNFLSGILMNRTVKIHPFLILVSVLGGLSFFGPVGFILGPLILAFLFALIEIYKASHLSVSK
jgi:predicted PurR-regulated permease PerM